MTVRSNNTGAATFALNQLVLRQIIVAYSFDFTAQGLVVTTRIKAQDELSAARAKRRVKEALHPAFPNATVVIRHDNRS